MSYFVGILSTMGWGWLVVVGLLLGLRARQLSRASLRERDGQQRLHAE